MERSFQLIRLLADGELHSGEQLAAGLGLSRAAVWKNLRGAAERFGVEVQAERGRGYRLAAPVELLSRECILAELSAAAGVVPAGLAVHDSIDSTNAALVRAAGEGAPSGSVCLAELQSAGRGRRGRDWVSPLGGGLAMSILWRYPMAASGLGALSLAVGAALAETLQGWALEQGEAAGERMADGLSLKWPNDLLWQGRKFAGILIEISGEAQGPTRLVLGLGLNLRLPAAAAELIDQPCVDLDTILGEMPPRNRLVARLIDALFGVLASYEEDAVTDWIDRWRRFDRLQGREIELLLGEQRILGRHAGIGEEGALLVDVADEGVRAFHAGEVSLRAREES